MDAQQLQERRERIAAAALQGMLASNGQDWDIGPDKFFTAVQCVQYADAMIKALEQPFGECKFKIEINHPPFGATRKDV